MLDAIKVIRDEQELEVSFGTVMAMVCGLELASELGIRKLLLEFDSTLAVEFVTKTQAQIDSNYALVAMARGLLTRD
ncbi:hypothetical protein Peur_072169 [Populus x canadensis]